MGVTILQQFPIENNQTPQAVIEMLTQRVIALGAEQTGNFLVDCETYSSVPQLGHQRTVHVMHNSEQPATVFSILETGTKTIPLIADGLFDLLMMKMSSFYASKKQTKAESKGPRFELDDFIIKLGIVTVGSNFEGVLVEVEYAPCFVPALCWDFMKEFFQGLLGPNVMSAPSNHLQSRMQELYNPIDTIHQYLEYFTMWRKTCPTTSNTRPQ